MASNEDLLGQEYFHLQKVIEDYDTKTLTVKAWSVTFSATAIGFAYDKHERVILVVALASSLAFWVMEALLKANQQAYYHRIGEIEIHFSGGEQRKPLQIGAAWEAAFKAAGGYHRISSLMRWPHVFMPHLAIGLLALVLLLVIPPAPLQVAPRVAVDQVGIAKPASPPPPIERVGRIGALPDRAPPH